MRHFLFLCVAAVVSSTSATGADVYGRVVDALTGDPVAGANVSAGGHADITGEDGIFRIFVVADSVSASHIAYQAARVAVHRNVVIELQPLTRRMRETIVRAGLSEETLQQSQASVSVLDAVALSGTQHLQDVTASIPNLNWAGGTTRPQYFQIRGVGERSNYAGEGPPSFSVGTVVDDIDLSGLATGGQLFDMEQVEVYRGPQSTIFGANAMGGLIHLRSSDPTDKLVHGISAGSGTDGLLEASGYINVPLGQQIAVRAGYAQGRSNGFRDNVYLQRDDTNRRRENVGRVKALWTRPGGTRLTATLLRVDADNRYDAWAPDNNRSLRTYSDNPGVDRQQTLAASLRAELPLTRKLQLVSISAVSSTDADYSFDGDWGNAVFWRAAPYEFDAAVEGYSYDFFDDLDRERGTWTQELRLVQQQLPALGGSGIVGVFARGLQQDTDATGYLFGGDATDLTSRFDIDEFALYARHRRALRQDLQLTATVRADHNQTRYAGTTNGGAESVQFDIGAWLMGGRVALNLDLGNSRAVFASVSRGYRAGGINQHPRLSSANRPYSPEYVLNSEAGYRWQARRGQLSVTAFYGRRSSQQVELSTQQDAGDPNSFVYFTNNAGAGRNAGVEVDGRYDLYPGVGVTGALGYLHTQVDGYTFLTGAGESLTLGDREAAHAPPYNARLSLHTTAEQGPQARLEWTAMDGFFFSDSHDQRSGAYTLWNGSVGYNTTNWSLRLWGRNLLDTRYAVRGFFFGLEPPAYEETLYVSYGDPRQLGVTLSARFQP